MYVLRLPTPAPPAVCDSTVPAGDAAVVSTTAAPATSVRRSTTPAP